MKMKSDTTRIVENVIKKLKYYQVNDKQTFIDRARHYTGFHPKFLEELWNSDDISVEPEEPIQRSVILEELLSFYLVYTMPNTKELFMQVYDKIPKWIKIQHFVRILRQMGFMWLRFNKKRVIYERPSVTFSRFEYLQKIIRYRKEEKNIVYICELAYDFLGNCYEANQSSRLNKVLPLIKQSRWIYSVGFNGVYNCKKVNEFDEITIQEYVIELSRDFNEPTVFVYDQSKHHNESVCAPLNLRTLKIDIIKWLEMHNIPYDSKASKYHLYELAQKHRDVDESLFILDRILIAKGHSVLRIPKCIRNISPGYILAQTMKNNIEMHNKDIVPDVFALFEYDKNILQVYDETFVNMIQYDAENIIEFADISGEEIKICNADIKIDYIIDDVRAKIKKC